MIFDVCKDKFFQTFIKRISANHAADTFIFVAPFYCYGFNLSIVMATQESLKAHSRHFFHLAGKNNDDSIVE